MEFIGNLSVIESQLKFCVIDLLLQMTRQGQCTDREE